MRSLVLAVAVALLACAPAEAVTTVAREGEFSLHASERDGRLCMTLRKSRRYQGEQCGRIPRSPHDPLLVEIYAGFFNNYAAAVPPSVRSVDAVYESGRREPHRTFRARGFSARFVLLTGPPGAVFVRLYSASGRLLAVVPGPHGYITFDNELQVFGEPANGVEAHTEPELSPTPEDPARLRTHACVDVANGSGGAGFCDDDADHGFALMGECEHDDLVGGVFGGSVADVRLTLGSGRQMTLQTVAYAGRRVLGATLPAREAVREAAALDGAGAVVARAAVGTPPGGQPCIGEDQGDDGFGGDLLPLAPPPGAVVAAAGGQDLLVGDQGERLCAGLGRLVARVCAAPPVDSSPPRLLRRGDAVAGVLSRDAARVTLQLDGRKRMALGTIAGTAYTGRWAGDLRFFAAEVGDREVTRAVVRNRHGRIIGISERGAPLRTVTRRVLAEQGGRGVRLVRRTDGRPCLTAFATDLPPAPRYCTVVDPAQPIDGPFLPYSGAVVVPCSPRAALAYGRMPDRFAAPRVLLAGGQSVTSRRISLRGEDAWVAFLPDAPVTGLRSGRHRVPLALPPASQQCGYSVDRGF